MVTSISGLAAGTAVALALAVSQSFGQSYPSKPIHVISPHPGGSAPDIVMRAAAQELSPRLGQTVLVDPRPGANAIIAMESCSRAAPDGYTVCLVSGDSMSFNPHVVSKLPYDPDRDFRPVTRLFFLIQGLIATGTLPADSIKDLVQAASLKPGSLNFGTLGPGSQPDVFRQYFADRLRIDIVGVPYKGTAMIANALAAGEIQLSMIGVGTAAGVLRSGKAKLLAISASRRYPLFPNVPAFSEVELEFPHTPFWGVSVPAGSSDAVVNRLNTEFVRLFREPKFIELLGTRYCEAAVGTPEEFAAFLKLDRERAGRLVKKYNIPQI